jgi:hypothetical protein
MYVYTRMYVCSPTLEAATPTVFMVWLLAQLVFNITPQLRYPEESRPVFLQYEAGWTLGPV